MVNTCVVFGCTNRSTPGNSDLKFFDLPKVIVSQGKRTEELTTERRRLWLARINRAKFKPDPSKRHYKVCSKHFISGMAFSHFLFTVMMEFLQDMSKLQCEILHPKQL
jgi:hypothetical protein